MNDFSAIADLKAAPDSKMRKSVAIPISGLTETDIREIRNALIQGEDSLARRKDIGEMHKRIVNMFSTLNQGLRESQDKKSAEDRVAIERRLEAMERSIDTMEGALRIELPPMLHEMIIEVTSAKKSNGMMPVSKITAIVTFCIGVAMGSAFSANIFNALTSVLSANTSEFDTSIQKSSLNGGSLKPANLLN